MDWIITLIVVYGFIRLIMFLSNKLDGSEKPKVVGRQTSIKERPQSQLVKETPTQEKPRVSEKPEEAPQGVEATKVRPIPYERLAELYIANPLTFIKAFTGMSCIVRGTISQFDEEVTFIHNGIAKRLTGSFIVFGERSTVRVVFYFEPDSSSDLFKLKIGDCVDIKGIFSLKTTPYVNELLFLMCTVQKVEQ